MTKVWELFERDDVTESEWQEALEVIEAEEKQEWANFLKRQENYDDAFYTDPWISRFRPYIRNRGYGFVYRLADLDGNLVKSKVVNGKFGEVWMVEQKDGSVEWVNVSVAESVAKQQAHYNKKGYQLVYCKVRVRLGQYHKPYLNMDEVVEVEVVK